MKKTIAIPLLSVLATAAIGIVGAAPAFAATPCPATATPGTVFHSSLTVSAGSPCYLNGVIVLGSVNVGTGASATIVNSRVALSVTVGAGASVVLDHSKVGNDVLATYSQALQLYSTTVGGTVRSQGSKYGTFVVCDNTINNDLVDAGVSSSDTPTIIGDPARGCRGNTIGGQLVLRGNQSPATVKNNTVGGISVINNPSTTAFVISYNIISNALACSGNVAVPTATGNVAASKTGQCAGPPSTKV